MILRFHRHMARMSAVRVATGIGRELVGCGVVVEQRVSPSAAFREFLAVFFHDESLRKDCPGRLPVHRQWLSGQRRGRWGGKIEQDVMVAQPRDGHAGRVRGDDVQPDNQSSVLTAFSQ